jgi:hypothetical protein
VPTALPERTGDVRAKPTSSHSVGFLTSVLASSARPQDLFERLPAFIQNVMIGYNNLHG